jgi:predicted ATPase
VDDTRVEVRVGRLPAAARGGARDTVNIADVGFGVSQTLPVLVALLAANRDQIVFVEQPELHLHPRAQVALADIIIQSAEQGVRLVIETHSSLLILALQAAIAAGRIAPDRVSLNWFTRDAAGQTHVTEAQVHEDGSYGDWPEDFGSIELDLQDRYMTLVERRHARD